MHTYHTRTTYTVPRLAPQAQRRAGSQEGPRSVQAVEVSAAHFEDAAVRRDRGFPFINGFELADDQSSSGILSAYAFRI
eukprot:4353620-Prymnesium_polylepis.1